MRTLSFKADKDFMLKILLDMKPRWANAINSSLKALFELNWSYELIDTHSVGRASEVLSRDICSKWNRTVSASQAITYQNCQLQLDDEKKKATLQLTIPIDKENFLRIYMTDKSIEFRYPEFNPIGMASILYHLIIENKDNQQILVEDEPMTAKAAFAIAANCMASGQNDPRKLDMPLWDMATCECII